MALHPSKEAALLPLCNFLTSGHISSVKDLADGKVLQKIISSAFPVFSKEFNKFENITDDDKTATCAKEEIIDISTIESEGANTEEVKNDENVQDSLIKLPEPLSGDNKEVSQRFASIQKFIDECYNLKSEEVISYSKCIEANELELAKVAFFVLAEVVQFFVQVNNENLQSLSHLELKTQEDIRECLELLISHKERLSKDEIEKVLSTHAKYKAPSPSQRSFFATPQRKCSSVYRRNFNPETPEFEEIFTNSPLKSFFESPVFKKEHIKQKDKEIQAITKRLHEEEIMNEELQYDLKDFEVKLQSKDKTIDNLKKELKELRNEMDVLKEKCATLQSDCEKYSSEQRKSEQEPLKFYLEQQSLCDQIVVLYGEVRIAKQEKEAAWKHAKMMVDKMHKEKSELEKELDETKQMLKKARENESVCEKEVSDCEKKLSDALAKESVELKENVELPALGENIGAIIDEDNRNLQDKLKVAELHIKELREKLSVKDQFAEQKQIKQSENSGIVNMPELLDMSNISESEKLRNSVMHSESSKELSYLHDKQYSLNNSGVTSKQLVISPQYETNRWSEDFGARLWRKYDSQSDSENSYEADPIDADHDLSTPGKLDKLECMDVMSENTKKFCLDLPENTEKLDSAAVPENTEKMDYLVVVPENDENFDCTDVVPEDIENLNYTSVPENKENLNSRNLVPEKKIDHTDVAANLNLPENSDVFENLNFNMFLDALKRISTNGSFKDVKEMLDKQKSKLSLLLKTSTSNGSNGYNLQVLLNVITECISVATASHYGCQDKGCVKSNAVNESAFVESNLKYQVNEMPQKHLLLKNTEVIQKISNQLKEKNEEIEKMKREKKSLEIKNEESLRKIQEMNTIIDNHRSQLRGFEQRLKAMSKENASVKKSLAGALKLNNYFKAHLNLAYKRLSKFKKNYDIVLKREKDLERSYATKLNSLKVKHNNEENYLNAFKTKQENEIKKLLQNEKELNKKIKKLTMDLESIKCCKCAVTSEENEKSCETASIFPEENKVIWKHSFYQNSESVVPEFYPTISQDIGNESTLSGALCNKTPFSLFVSHDEEDFLNQSSLADIKKDYRENDRVEELRRRNSVLPLHLQSAYPTEANLSLRSESLYMKHSEKEKYRKLHERLKHDNDHIRKKRKLLDMESEVQSRNSIKTPTTKMKKTFRTPSSLKKLLQFSRNQRPGYINPKP